MIVEYSEELNGEPVAELFAKLGYAVLYNTFLVASDLFIVYRVHPIAPDTRILGGTH